MSTYKEQLPSKCPPPEATPPTPQIVLRFVSNDPPNAQDFESYAAKGKPVPKSLDACSFASCSCRTADTPLHVLADMRKLPNLKKMAYVAKMKIDDKSGMARVNSVGHIDLWMFAAFDPVSAVVGVQALA